MSFKIYVKEQIKFQELALFRYRMVSFNSVAWLSSLIQLPVDSVQTQ